MIKREMLIVSCVSFSRNLLFELVNKSCYQNLRQHMSRILANLVPPEETLNDEHVRKLFFGNYMEPDADIKYYDEVRFEA